MERKEKAMTKDIATVKAALECTVEHLEGEHEGKVVVSADVFNTLYDFAETALSSPPAIDLAELQKENRKLRFMSELDRRAVDRWVPCPDHRDKTKESHCYVCENETLKRKLAAAMVRGDDLGELLQDGFNGLKYSFVFYKNGDEVFCTITDRSIAGSRKSIVCNGKGTTPAEAVRKAMDKMEDHPNGQ